MYPGPATDRPVASARCSSRRAAHLGGDGLGDAVDVAAAEQDLAGGDADDVALRVEIGEGRERGVVVAGSSKGTTTTAFAG